MTEIRRPPEGTLSSTASSGPTLGRRAVLLGLSGLPFLPQGLSASPVPRRKPLGPNAHSIHSGHSLTDAYIHTGSWPGHLRHLAEAAGVPDPFHKLVRSTIPGSPMSWRWSHAVEDYRPRDAIADARRDIAGFDSLVITEAGPLPRLGRKESQEALRHGVEYLCRFAANALENGANGQGARDIALWSIWPAHTLWRPDTTGPAAVWQDLPDFGAVTEGYGETFCWLADHASHVLRRAYPQLPPDWRIWVFPGHLFMQRLWRDTQTGAVPGIARFVDLFEDDIHPTSACGFGLACLMITCLYQVDLSRRKLGKMDGISPELRDYFAAISWQIAESYAPAGLGGPVATAPLWRADRDEDLLPGWTLKDALARP